MVPVSAEANLKRRHTGGKVAYSVTFVYLVIFCICISLVNAQTSSLTLVNDSTLSQNSLRFGLDKLANTFVFKGDADIQQSLFGGILRLNQNYRGTTVRSTSSAFRDDEILAIDHNVVINPNVDFYSRFNWFLSLDSRSIGLSSLERLQLLAGSKYKVDSTLRLNGFAGIERNKQLGNSDFGPLVGLNIELNDVIDQFNVEAGVHSEAAVFPERLNGEVEGNVKTYLYDKNNTDNFMSLSAMYKALNRDYYSLFNLQTGTSTSIESRLEQRYTLEALFGLSISQHWQGSLGFTTSELLVRRAFKQPLEGFTNTSVNRTLDQLNLTVNAQLQYYSSAYKHTVSVNSNVGYEDNIVALHFSTISQPQIDTLINIERLRNISFRRTRVSSQSNWLLSNADTINAIGAISILKYDTPSEKNVDDRDELQKSLTLSYNHRFHSGLSAGVVFQYQNNHLVFLNSLRSALNNENRIYRLAPNFFFDGFGIHSQAQMEVISQYTVYDFEGRGGVPQSFSFRQISIRDSIILSITPTLFSETRLYFRYFTRGEYYDSEFAELVLSKNYEQFIRSLLFTSAFDNLKVGAGVRLYALSQENTAQSATTTLLQSIAPDCSVIWNVNEGTQITITGWYEFQFTNKVRSRLLPNMNLQIQKNL